jgi:hypothetical protein
MNTDREARQATIIGRMRALEQQHREAVEAGDKTQAGAIYAQGQALYEGAVEDEREALEAMITVLSAETTLYGLNLKGSLGRMQLRNQNTM